MLEFRMNTLLALAIVGLLIYSTAMLIAAVFKSPRKPKIKRAMLAFAGMFVAAFALGTREANQAVSTHTVAGQPETVAQRPSAPSVAAPASPAQAVTSPPVPPSTPQDDYVERLDREIAGVSRSDAKEYVDSSSSLMIGLALLQAWAKLYEEGDALDLSPEQEAKRQAFKSLVARKQAEFLPVLRDAYGPIMRQALWEADGKARTIGRGYRTVEFINGSFAANRNIKAVHEEVYPTLMMLRFTRAEYKWIPDPMEYSFYTLTPPSDDQLVSWRSNGSFTVLE